MADCHLMRKHDTKPEVHNALRHCHDHRRHAKNVSLDVWLLTYASRQTDGHTRHNNTLIPFGSAVNIANDTSRRIYL